MPMSDLCEKRAITIEKSATLEEAATMMRKHHVGSLVVVNVVGKSQRPVGVLTDRDIVLKGVAEKRTLGTTTVDQIMSRDPVEISRNSGVFEALRKMRRNNVRRVVVTDEGNGICGLFSTDDLIRLIAQEMHEVGQLFEEQVSREEPTRPAVRARSA